jgi:hypothetical protein
VQALLHKLGKGKKPTATDIWCLKEERAKEAAAAAGRDSDELQKALKQGAADYLSAGQDYLDLVKAALDASNEGTSATAVRRGSERAGAPASGSAAVLEQFAIKRLEVIYLKLYVKHQRLLASIHSNGRGDQSERSQASEDAEMALCGPGAIADVTGIIKRGEVLIKAMEKHLPDDQQPVPVVKHPRDCVPDGALKASYGVLSQHDRQIYSYFRYCENEFAHLHWSGLPYKHAEAASEVWLLRQSTASLTSASSQVRPVVYHDLIAKRKLRSGVSQSQARATWLFHCLIVLDKVVDVLDDTKAKHMAADSSHRYMTYLALLALKRALPDCESWLADLQQSNLKATVGSGKGPIASPDTWAQGLLQDLSHQFGYFLRYYNVRPT